MLFRLFIVDMDLWVPATLISSWHAACCLLSTLSQGDHDVIYSRVINVLVLLADQQRDSELLELTVRRGWRMSHEQTENEAIKLVLRFRPKAVVLEVCDYLGEALDIIYVLRNRWPNIPVIAVALFQDNSIERSVRAAGASAYFCGEGRTGLVEKAVDAIAAKFSAMIL